MSDTAAVHARIERLGPALCRFTERFCAFPTVNPPGRSYHDCVQFLREKLDAIGLHTRCLRVPKRVQRALLPGSDDYPRYNLIGRWDVGAARTLHFNGHYDVVPITGGWKGDPFKARRRGDKLYARGSCDMKGPDSAAIFAIQALKESGVRPPWNLEISLTADEETGGEAGLGHLVRSGAIAPDAAVLCEGASGDCVGYAHRGVLWLELTVHGVAGHGSHPRGGVNALEKACALIARLRKLDRVYAGADRRSAYLAGRAARRPSIMIGGVCHGGGKVNTIPDRFSFTLDRRMIPEERKADVLREIKQVIAEGKRADRELRVSVRELLHVPAGTTDPDAAIVQIARRAVKAVRGRLPRLRMGGGFTDMHWLSEDGGVPTVGYGVQGGDIHGDAEWCSMADLVATAKVYAEIALRMA